MVLNFNFGAYLGFGALNLEFKINLTFLAVRQPDNKKSVV